jgi:hypothetical protein
MLIDAGPHDQRSVHGLPDYGLIYCSEALPEDLTIAGEVCVTFPCSRTAPTPILSPSSSTGPPWVFISEAAVNNTRGFRSRRAAGLDQLGSRNVRANGTATAQSAAITKNPFAPKWL